MTAFRLLRESPKHLILAVLAVLSLFPIYFMLVNSLKDTLDVAVSPLSLPTVMEWGNFGTAWDVIGRPIVNTVVIVGVSLFGILLCSSMSAYAFAVLEFPFRKFLFGLVFVLLLVPGFLTLIPLFLQIQKLGLSDNYLGLILPYVAAGQAFSIFVLTTFFRGLARETVEAARIDGAGDFRIYRDIVLPLQRPILVTVGIINLIPLWSDLLLPQLILGERTQTVTMALVAFQGGAQSYGSPAFGPLMAAYVIAAIPLVLVFAFLMKYYVEGITSGGALKL